MLNAFAVCRKPLKMNRIQQLFENKQKDILNIYFTAGFPNLEDTETIILTLAEAGVDLIEIGMPYSDPLADGETIQESSQVALSNGMKVNLLFEQVQAAREKTQTPLILMGYFNQVMQYGERAFFEKCKAVGIDGLILPDLPIYEYETFYQSILEELDLGISFLITPQTEEERVIKMDELSKGFIYMVSNASITGAKRDITEEQEAYFNRINEMDLKTPRLIGFGISNHATFKTACAYANGAIIGSAFIKALQNGKGVLKDEINKFVDWIKLEA
jgi:tryptophan synthase alpha chain